MNGPVHKYEIAILARRLAAMPVDDLRQLRVDVIEESDIKRSDKRESQILYDLGEVLDVICH